MSNQFTQAHRRFKNAGIGKKTLEIISKLAISNPDPGCLTMPHVAGMKVSPAIHRAVHKNKDVIEVFEKFKIYNLLCAASQKEHYTFLVSMQTGAMVTTTVPKMLEGCRVGLVTATGMAMMDILEQKHHLRVVEPPIIDDLIYEGQIGERPDDSEAGVAISSVDLSEQIAGNAFAGNMAGLLVPDGVDPTTVVGYTEGMRILRPNELPIGLFEAIQKTHQDLADGTMPENVQVVHSASLNEDSVTSN